MTNDDWFIVFNSLELLSDGTYKYSGHNGIGTNLENVNCPFEIYIINENNILPAEFIICETNLNNNRWEIIEPIILKPITNDIYLTSFQIDFEFSNKLPTFGDTLFIKTYKPLKDGDEFLFSPSKTFTSMKPEIKNSFFSLSQNYPNPFNPTTKIKYSIPQDIKGEMSNVKLVVFDILGREIKTLVNESKKPGNYEVEFNAKNLSSGIYFYKLQTGNFSEIMKMILMK
ncbi:MAG: T9SS type A sorting domain-containing protein [Ignavibacteriae bacterium]|nr:T9SS type A sorting domain-containing protein [Ignavibacteriota bacterium]